MAFNVWVLGHEPIVRLSVFFGMFALMGVWETLAPRRARLLPRRLRWPAPPPRWRAGCATRRPR